MCISCSCQGKIKRSPSSVVILHVSNENSKYLSASAFVHNHIPRVSVSLYWTLPEIAVVPLPAHAFLGSQGPSSRFLSNLEGAIMAYGLMAVHGAWLQVVREFRKLATAEGK